MVFVEPHGANDVGAGASRLTVRGISRGGAGYRLDQVLWIQRDGDPHLTGGSLGRLFGLGGARSRRGSTTIGNACRCDTGALERCQWRDVRAVPESAGKARQIPFREGGPGSLIAHESGIDWSCRPGRSASTGVGKVWLESVMQAQPKARTEGLLSEMIGKECVVYDTTNSRAHALSDEAASVWRCCDGTRSPALIAAELSLEVELVQAALVELERCGLLEQAQPPPQFSRREVGVTLGKAALLGPLVYSVVVPAAASAASPTKPCPAGAIETRNTSCYTTGPADGPTGSLQTPGNAGFSSRCPVIGGNTGTQNCYVTNGNATVCTSPMCIRYPQGCSPSGTGVNQCCAGAGCCKANPSLPGSFNCSQ